MYQHPALIANVDPNQWEKLFQHALFPTMETSPIWATGIFNHFATTSEQLLTAHNRLEQNKALNALMFISKHSWTSAYPGIVLKSKASDFTFSGAPLIHSQNSSTAFLNLISNAKTQFSADSVIFNNCPGEGVFIDLLDEMTHHGLHWQRLECRERAVLLCNKSYDTWFTDAISKKRRKEYRRMRTRLSEQGALLSERKKENQPIEPWIEQFLQLEAAGWKGRRKTAIANSAANSAFFREVVPQLAQRGELMFWRLSLDDRPLAMLVTLIINDHAWLIKIAYDEQYHRYSPGVLIMLDATAWFLQSKQIILVDSCAQPNHPMIDHLWRERNILSDFIISTPGTSCAKFAAQVKTEQIRRILRNNAKRAYYKITNRRAV